MRSKLTVRNISLLIIWSIFLAFVTFLFWETGQGRWDFITYHIGARNLVAGNPLYAGTSGREDYIYPPILAQILAPLTTIFSFDVLSLLWHLLNIVLLIWTTYIFTKHTNNPRLRFMMWLAPILFIPNVQAFWVGQVSFIILWALTVAWAAYKKGQHILVGVVLASMAWLKVYPSIFLLYFLWRREWRIISVAAITGLFIGIIQILISGIPTLITYFTDILPKLAAEGQGPGLFKNSSILGFSFKMFTDTPAIQPLVNSPELANLTRFFVSALVLGVTAYLILRRSADQPTSDLVYDSEYALLVVFTLIFASTLWESGMTPLLLTYFLLLRHPAPITFHRLCWLSFALLAIYFPYLLAFQPGNKLHALTLSIGFYGAFLLWGLATWRLLQATTDKMQTASNRAII